MNLIIEKSNLVQLLVSIFSLFWFSADFLELLLKRRHLKNLKKSANKFKENKKFNIMMKTKESILALIY